MIIYFFILTPIESHKYMITHTKIYVQLAHTFQKLIALIISFYYVKNNRCHMALL